MQAQLEQIIESARLNRQYKLSLDSHQLSTLPESLGSLIDLCHLNLRDNQLTSLPESITDLINLDWLALDKNQLTSLPESIFSLVLLSKLALNDNQLTNLPASIGNLSELTYLNIANNQLINLPESIGSLTNLSWLDLANNQIDTLPNSIKSLCGLTYLNLDGNPIGDLSALKSSYSLETVRLFGSSLPYQYWTEFSEWKAEWLLDEDDARIRRALIKQVGFDRVCQLSGLTRLELNNWQLTELPANVENLCNLLNLDLTDNQLASLPENIGNLSRLYDLKLSRNQLTSLPESFENLFNLSNLDLSLNKLEKLPDNFIYLLNLTTIDLNGNLIEDLSILQSLLNLKTVCFYNVYLPRRYWIKFSEWKSEWLLDEDNVEIRQILIERIGYDRICTELKAVAIDTWREYTLLKIDGVEKIYDDEEQPIDTEPMVLLKMTCPSTAHIHILRVPPEMVSAEAAITWVNHGIHPDEFIVQT